MSIEAGAFKTCFVAKVRKGFKRTKVITIPHLVNVVIGKTYQFEVYHSDGLMRTRTDGGEDAAEKKQPTDKPKFTRLF